MAYLCLYIYTYMCARTQIRGFQELCRKEGRSYYGHRTAHRIAANELLILMSSVAGLVNEHLKIYKQKQLAAVRFLLWQGVSDCIHRLEVYGHITKGSHRPGLPGTVPLLWTLWDLFGLGTPNFPGVSVIRKQLATCIRPEPVIQSNSDHLNTGSFRKIWTI